MRSSCSTPPTPPSWPRATAESGATVDAEARLLVPTVELALAVARTSGTEPGGAPPPAPLRPLLGFRGRTAERTVATVREVLDADPAFRERVARALDEVTDPDPVAVLVLRRPDGWEAEFAERVERARSERSEQRAAAQDSALQRRLDGVRSALAERESELAARADELRAVRSDLERERSRRVEAEREIAERSAGYDALVAERDRAVRELADARRETAAVHAELQAVRAEPQEVLDPVVEAARRSALDELVRLLDDLDRAAGALRVSLEPPEAPGTGAAPSGSGPAPRVRRRRVPVQLRRGVVEGTVEGVEQLLRVPGVVVLVDGYNLSMSAWPDLGPAEQREQVVRLLTDLRSRTGAEVHVVFDGGDVGERPAVHVPLGVRTHFSPVGVEADDVLIGVVPTLPVDRAVVVVSSDRRVRDGVRPFGANVLRSAELLRWARGAR